MVGVRRRVLVLCLFALVACQAEPSSPPGASPAPSASVTPDASPAPAPAGSAAPEPDGGDARGQGIGPTPRSTATRAPSARRLDDLGGLGALCRDYLRARRLVVEIDWEAGAEPAASARAHLIAALRQVTGAQVTLAGGQEVAGSREVWSAQDLRATAAAHRSHYSTAEQPALYVLSVGGRFEDEGALGVAHRASELAMFPRRIGRLSRLLGGDEAVQRAVLVHEAGHLLCLVNIGYTSAFAREDPEHPKHSNDRASVMHWAIDTSAVGQLFNGPPPDSFTAQDLADLQALKGGRP